MSDTSGPNGQGSGIRKEVVPFLKQNAAWATGSAAMYLNYKAMSRIFWGGMAGRGPAVVFVAAFGLINYAGYRNLTSRIKVNAKEAYKRSQELGE